jgi:hypothetical protein
MAVLVEPRLVKSRFRQIGVRLYTYVCVCVRMYVFHGISLPLHKLTFGNVPYAAVALQCVLTECWRGAASVIELWRRDFDSCNEPNAVDLE